MELENKKLVRILKEIGLFTIWKEERTKYYICNDLKKQNCPFFPNGSYFSSCISSSFVWVTAKHTQLWATIGEESWKYTHIKPTCDNILKHEELLSHLRNYVKNYFEIINNKG